MTRPLVIGALIAISAGVGSHAQQPGAQASDARIEGHVFSTDTGLPLDNATVRLAGGPTPKVSAADENGRFELSGVAPGRYLLTAVIAGYAIGTFGQRSPADAPRSIELKAGVTRTQADIRLTPLGTLSGRIQDEQGQPMSGVQVQAVRRRHAGGDLLGGRVARPGTSATTDRNGEYRIRDLTPGSYDVIAVPNAKGLGRALPGSPDATARQPVPTFYPGVVVPGEAQTVRIELGADTLVSFDVRTSRFSNVSGTVFDSRGRPAPDVLVRLDHTSVQLPIAVAAQIFSEVTEDGRFVLHGVPPGDYHVDARSKAAWEAIAQRGGSRDIRVNSPEFASARVRVTGEDVQELVLRMGAGFVLSGRLTAEGTLSSQAIRAVQVSSNAVGDASQSSASLHSDTTSPRADGSFRLEKLLGTQMIRV
jgi:hypothetical protein